MKIRTRLWIATGISVAIAVLIGVVLTVTFARVRQQMERIRHTDDIVRSVFDLKLVTSDYQSLGLDRTHTQWRIKHRMLGRDLDTFVPASIQQGFTLRRMKDNHASLKRTFEAFRDVTARDRRTDSTRDSGMDMERRLTAKMDACLLTLTSDANQLVDSIYADLAECQAIVAGIVASSSVTMVLLIFALAVMVTRTTIRPLRKLGHDASLIGQGNLEHRTGMTASDEVGDLSRAFDNMLDRLNDVMAHRDELNSEVAQRKEAEKKLRNTLANLERSNRDLEQFAYSASHDLQEPLRKVMAFGSLLTNEYGQQLEGDGAMYIQSMQNATKRMQTLINDLLTFSRVTTRGKEFVRIELNAVVQGVLSDLETRIQETGAVVEVADLPEIEADPTQMRQLFQNLIGNALKFHREGTPPRVRVYRRAPDREKQGARTAAKAAATAEEPPAQSEHRTEPRAAPGDQKSNNAVQLVVEDNGIGFDKKYSERIFGVFQRLHGRGEYSGSGIGLAVCRRIAERHGGTIAAEGAPGHGARFVVTLPREPSRTTTEVTA